MIQGMTRQEIPASDEMTGDEPRYSLSELTEEAGVSVRTVRYYIAEGLLPPPAGAGPRSHYTRAHLDRLRLIDRLKTAYLPLKEIRRRLVALDDAEVRRLVEQEPARPPESRPPDSAASYIARLLHRPSPSKPAATGPFGAALRADGLRRHRKESDAEPEAVARRSEPDLDVAALLPEPPLAATPSPPGPSPTESAATSWRRIPLGDDAELLIRDETYHRKREHVDWLVGWARKVLG
jgi:DNA-binding transcriptional MerR regulator